VEGVPARAFHGLVIIILNKEGQVGRTARKSGGRRGPAKSGGKAGVPARGVSIYSLLFRTLNSRWLGTGSLGIQRLGSCSYGIQRGR
jgi:hypothetical protein